MMVRSEMKLKRNFVMNLKRNFCTVPVIGLCNENEDAIYVRPQEV